MKSTEAAAILEEIMRENSARGFQYWQDQMASSPRVLSVRGPSGTSYQVEIDTLWDDPHLPSIRVVISIDDGGLASFAPLTADFIVQADA